MMNLLTSIYFKYQAWFWFSNCVFEVEWSIIDGWKHFVVKLNSFSWCVPASRSTDKPKDGEKNMNNFCRFQCVNLAFYRLVSSRQECLEWRLVFVCINSMYASYWQI